MKTTGLTVVEYSAPVIETDDGDVLKPLRQIAAKYAARAAYLKHFPKRRAAQPKNVKVVRALPEPGLHYQQAAEQIQTLFFQ
jgi:hypothetical protein